MLRGVGGGFGNHHDPFTLFRHLFTERDYAPLAHPGQLADGLLDVLGVVVTTRLDDQVLDATGDEQLPVDQVAQVASVQPVAHPNQRSGFWPAEIAGHHRLALDQHAALEALRKWFEPLVCHVDDSDLLPIDRGANGYQGAGPGSGVRRHGSTGRGQQIGVDVVHPGTPFTARDRHRNARLRKSVARREGAPAEAVGLEAAAELVDGGDSNGFRPHHRELDAG